MATAKKKTSAALGPKCECGGTLKPATLRNYDFSHHAGLPVFLDGAPGWKCTACQRELLLGEVINITLFLIAIAIVEMPHRLAPEMAKYLRRWMQLTQQELSDRMGVVRETIANWEVGLKDLSAQNDFILRVLLINHAQGVKALPAKEVAKNALAIAHSAMAGLSAVKNTPPPLHPHGLRVTESDFKKFPSAFHKPAAHAS